MQLVKPSIVIAALTALCWSTIKTPAADWPQWRGPQRTGISSETGLLHDWPTDGPKLIWRSEKADSGYSTPAIIGGRMYLLGNRGMDDEFVKALSTKDGSEIWSVRIGKVGPNIPEANYPGARSTPTVDGDVLFALGSDGNLMCLETAGGKLRWQKDVRTELGGQPGKWAYAESPLVDGDVLVCTPGGAERHVGCAEQEKWRSDLEIGRPRRRRSGLCVNYHCRLGERQAIRSTFAKRSGRHRRQNRKILVAVRRDFQEQPRQYPHAGGCGPAGLQRDWYGGRRTDQADRQWRSC